MGTLRYDHDGHHHGDGAEAIDDGAPKQGFEGVNRHPIQKRVNDHGPYQRAIKDLRFLQLVFEAIAGGTLRTAIIGDDQGLLGPFLGVGSILAMDKVLAWLCTRFPRVNRRVEGFPTLLIRNGKRNPDALRSQNLPDAALDRALHGAGMETDEEVQTVRLEPNGKTPSSSANA